jgi:hypothetical protein
LPPNIVVRLVVHAGSPGRTTRPRSSIQTPVGTLVNWNAELTACARSISVVKVALAASYHLPAAASPPVSCAAATISKFLPFSSS